MSCFAQNVPPKLFYAHVWFFQLNSVNTSTYFISSELWEVQVLTIHCIWQIAVEPVLCSLNGLTMFTLSSSPTPTPTHLLPPPISYVTTITLTSTTTAKLFATRVSTAKVSKDLACLQTYHYLMVLVGFLSKLQINITDILFYFVLSD